MSERTRRRTVEVVNRLGMHARPSADFVRLASRFAASITVSRGDSRREGPVGKGTSPAGSPMAVNGKSIMGVLMLAAERGSRLTISAEGEDAEGAVEALAGLVRRGFGE